MMALPFVVALPAEAGEEISVVPNSVIHGEVGSVHVVASQEVPSELVGKPCDLRVTAKNGGSVHPGNAVMVSTGASDVTVAKIEEASDESVTHVQRVTMGDSLTVSIQLGQDGTSSLGFTVGFECTPGEMVPDPGTQTTTTVTTPPVDTTPTSAPEVKPARQELPEAPPAEATTGEPNFTG